MCYRRKNEKNNYSLHSLKGENEILIKDTNKVDLLYRRNKAINLIQKLI